MTTRPQKSPAPAGDGLGYRVLGFDKQTGDRLDMLRVRPQFSAHAPFDRALRDRLARLAAFADPAFARVRQIDRIDGPSPSLVIVSPHVFGVRLTEMLSVAESFDVRVDIGTALALVRQLTAAIGTLHRAGDGISHGCIGPERVLLTADGRLVITEYILGSALDAMHWPREKFWHESRIVLSATDQPAVFDRQTDVLQIGLLALALLAGRAVYAERRYPHPLAQHLAAARALPIDGPPHSLSPALTEWLARALQRDRLSAFTTTDEALFALEQAIDDGGYDARLSTVAAFITRCRQASPDLTPREVDAAREVERLLMPPATSRPVHTPAAAAPIGARPSEASVSTPVPSRPAPPPVTIGGGVPLHGTARVPVPVVAPGEPIEFVPAVAERAVAIARRDEPPAAAPAFVESPVEETNSLLDMDVLVGMLRRPRAPFAIHVDQQPLLFVEPMRHVYRLMTTPGADAARPEPPPIDELVARLRRGRLRYRDAAIEELPASGPGFPIERLVWHLGLVLHPDDLLPQVKARGHVQLARWPDFGRIRPDAAQLKMTALLTSRSVALDNIFQAIGEPRPRVIAFLNACALCGLFADTPIEAPPQTVVSVATEGRPLAGLMQRLRGALGIGRA